MERAFRVWADWQDLSGPREMGILRETGEKGRFVVSFEYMRDWLGGPEAQTLDPELQLFTGRQYTSQDKALFGVFLDSAPDRWGRMLIKRREMSAARAESRSPRRLTEIDYVMEVNDFSRVGALRFQDEAGGEFLASGGENAVPPWVRLRSLEEAARHVDEDRDDTDEWLAILFAPGSSLGGARPKASVQAPDGSLWIAKFPAKNDNVDSGAWEKLVYDLARRSGLQTVESRLEQFSPGGSTFLVKRFDRKDGGDRLHYASALTLLGKNDGASAVDGTSYLEMAEFLRRSGSRPKDDLKELWSRIVFSIAVTNTDDHLRNHGFLLERRGWRLSPLFDVNPNPEGYGLSLNISEDDNSLDFNLALGQARHFGLSDEEAQGIVQTIRGTVAEWRESASASGLSPSAIRSMEYAFRV